MTALKIALPLGTAAVIAGLGAALLTGGLIAAAPPANAGCRYGGPVSISQCDGPVQPDGTWQRCVEFPSMPSNRGYVGSDKRCDLMGPDQHPWGLAFADPPTHIDD